MIGGVHPCLKCKNFIEKAKKGSGDLGRCRAFPDNIPDTVYAFMHPWDKPKECNDGIGFETKDDNKDGD